MSGFEVAGVTLAIFSAAIQCLGGRKAITGFVRCSADFKRLNRKTRMKLFLQEKHFTYQCQRLLAGLRAKTEIDAMFGDEDESNPCWKDGDWERELRDYLGDAFDETTTAIELVLLEFDALRKLLDKSGSLKSGVSAPESREIQSSGSGHADDILAQKSIPLLTKKRLAGKEEKITQNLITLKDSIDEYRQVVTRFLDSKFDTISLHKRPSRAPRKSNLDLATVRLIQDRSCRLYNALQDTGNCPCHRLNLRLGFDSDFLHSRNNVSIPSQEVFRLVAVLETHHHGLETLMDIDGAPNISKDQVQALEVKPRLVASPKAAAKIRCDESPPCNNSSCVPVPKPTKKRVGFSFDLPKMTGKRPPIAEEGSPSPEPVEENLEVTEIDSLCLRLSQIAPEQPSTRIPSSPCLGYLSGTDDYQYLIYKTGQLNPNMRDQSLQELLQTESKDMRLSVRNRLQIAFTLALSLLQLHSSQWITKCWRSRDVILFREDKQKWSPYVAAAFNAIRQGQFSNASTEATNDRESKLKSSAIFGLGVVLLEVGRSRLLLDPSSFEDGSDAAEERDTAKSEMRERLAACSHVLKKSVAGELGPRYQDVVEKCILWDDDDDLSEIVVQKNFCEKVVCELDICLTKFDEQ